jgi:hypothetical protein
MCGKDDRLEKVSAVIARESGWDWPRFTRRYCYDWNTHKRKSDPSAPVGLAIVLGMVYVVTTLGLVVFLEVWPTLSTYALAIFPALAVVGALNLAVISRQEQRELEVARQKAEQRARRLEKKQQLPETLPESRKVAGNGHGKQYGNWQAFLEDHPNMLEMNGRQIAELAGVSERTGNNWKTRKRE